MNVQILLEGMDITNYVIRYTTEHKICDGRGMLNLEVVNTYDIASILTYNTVILYEEGIKKGTYHVATKTRNAEKGYTLVGCQDGSKRLDDYFVELNYNLNYPTSIRYWIEKFLNDAHISYNITASGTGGTLSENSSIGMDSLYSILQGLLQQAGWYIYMDADDVAQIGTLDLDLENIATSLDESTILNYESSKDDNMLRNRVVIWGNANPATNSQVYVDVSTHTPWDYDLDDVRTVVIANSMITESSQGYFLANKVLKETTQITFTKKITFPGIRDIGIGDIIYVDSRDFTGVGLVTTIETSVAKDGMITNLILDERCPRLYGFYGYTGGYVYIGTKGSGVWRKPLKYNHTWSNYSTGITNLNIIDLAISDGLFAAVAEDGYLYTRKITSNSWSKIAHPALTHVVTNEPVSGIMCTSCSIDKINNHIYATYVAHSGITYNYYYPAISGELSGSWLVDMASPGGSRSITPIILDNVPLQNYTNPTGNPLPSGEFRVAALDVDNDGFTQFVSSINYIGASGIITYSNESLGSGGFDYVSWNVGSNISNFTNTIPSANSGNYLVTHTEIWDDYVNAEYTKILANVTIGNYPTGFVNTPMAIKTSKYIPTIENRASIFYVNPSSDLKINKTTQYYDFATTSWKIATYVYDFTSYLVTGTVCLYMHLENDLLYILWYDNTNGNLKVHTFNTTNDSIINTNTHSITPGAMSYSGADSYSCGRMFYFLPYPSATYPNDILVALNLVTGDYYYGSGVYDSDANGLREVTARHVVGMDEYGLYWCYGRLYDATDRWKWQLVVKSLTVSGISFYSIIDMHYEYKTNVRQSSLSDFGATTNFVAPAQGAYLIAHQQYYLFEYQHGIGHRTFFGSNGRFNLNSNNNTVTFSFLVDIFNGTVQKWRQEGHQIPFGPWVWDSTEDILEDYGIEYINSASNPTFSRTLPDYTTLSAKNTGAFGIARFSEGLRIVDADTCIVQNLVDITGVDSDTRICSQVDDIDNSVYVNLKIGVDSFYGISRFGTINKIIKISSESGGNSFSIYPITDLLGNSFIGRSGNTLRWLSFYPNDPPAYTASNRHTYRIEQKVDNTFIQNTLKFNQPINIESSLSFPISVLGIPTISGVLDRTGYTAGENDSGLYVSPFGINNTFSRIDSNAPGAVIPDARIMNMIDGNSLKTYVIFPETTTSGNTLYFFDAINLDGIPKTYYTNSTEVVSGLAGSIVLSGMANHIETSNNQDYPYIFVSTKGTVPNFYQKDGYNKGEASTAFVLRNTNLPDSQITVIRVDDII